MPPVERQIPEAIKVAQKAMEILKSKGVFVAEMQKLLPAYAMKLSQQGEEVTVEGLLEAAEKGVEYLKAPRTNVQSRKKVLTYEGVVARLKEPKQKDDTKKDDSIDDLPIDAAIEKYTLAKDTDSIFYFLDENLISPERVLNIIIRSSDKEEDRETKTYVTQALLERYDVDVNAHDVANHKTPLQYSLDHSDDEIVALLLNHGADVNLRDKNKGWLPLDYCNTVEQLKLLIDKGADVNARDFAGLTPLYAFVMRGKVEHVKLLLESGADARIKSYKGKTPLHWVGNSLEIAEILVDAGVDINAASNTGRTALHDSMLEDRKSVAVYLLRQGATVNVQDKDGETPLHWAAQFDKPDLVHLLLNFGADIHAKTEKGFTPLWLALQHAAPYALLALANRGAGLPEGDTFALVKTLKSFCVNWEKSFGEKTPFYLPYIKKIRTFDDGEYTKIRGLFKKDGIKDDIVQFYSLVAYAVFGTEENVLKYFERWGKKRDKPLAASMRQIDFNAIITAGHKLFLQQKEVPPDLKEWTEAIIAHGPAMARFFHYFNRLPLPELNDDCTDWSVTKTHAEIIKLSYEDVGEQHEVAKLCFDYGYQKDLFDLAKRANGVFLGEKKLPKLEIEGGAFDKPGYRFSMLEEGDPLGLVLGLKVGNCQHLDNNGSECALHGHFSREGAFYVVRNNKGDVVAETWAFRGEQGELVMDSLEGLPGHLDHKKWTKLLNAFALAVEAEGNVHNITEINVGTDGDTPVGLLKEFDRVASPSKPKGFYMGHLDSVNQVRVWSCKR